MEKKLILRNDSILFIIFLLIPHFKPPMFNDIPVLDIIFNAFRVVSAFTIILLLIRLLGYENDANKKWSKILFALGCYYVALFIGTLLNGISINSYILRVASQVSILLICYYYSLLNPQNLTSALFFISELFTYSNLITIFLHPDGLYRSELYVDNWLLGYRNSFFQYFLGFIVVAMLYGLYKGRWIRPVILLVSILYTLIRVNSVTSIISMGIFLACVIGVLVDKGRLINSLTLGVICIVSYILIVLFRNINAIYFIIDGIFNKSSTLLGRMNLWDRIYKLISVKPILGWGCMDSQSVSYLLGRGWATHAHNLILQCLLESGIVGTLFFVVFIVLIFSYLYKYKNTPAGMILTIGVFTLMIAQLTEVYNREVVFIVYGLACAIDGMSRYREYNVIPVIDDVVI